MAGVCRSWIVSCPISCRRLMGFTPPPPPVPQHIFLWSLLPYVVPGEGFAVRHADGIVDHPDQHTAVAFSLAAVVFALAAAVTTLLVPPSSSRSSQAIGPVLAPTLFLWNMPVINQLKLCSSIIRLGEIPFCHNLTFLSLKILKD